MLDYSHNQLAFIVALQLAAENHGHKSDRAELLERFPKLADQLELYFESGDIAITCGCCDTEAYHWQRSLAHTRQLVAKLKSDDLSFLIQSYLQFPDPGEDLSKVQRRLALLRNQISDHSKQLHGESVGPAFNESW